MNSDTKYLKRELRGWSDHAFGLPLRQWVRVVAAGPSGSKLQRVALAWLGRKCKACARVCTAESRDRDASLARKARHIVDGEP